MSPLRSSAEGKIQRPRSQRAHDLVLEAAIELMSERGIEGTSIDAIANQSGVSKATIYKHWKDKEALCLEAVGRVHGCDREPQQLDSGDLLRDFTEFLQVKPPAEFAQVRSRLMPHLVAFSARNAEFGRAWRQQAIEPGRKAAIKLIRRGIERKLLSPDLDTELGIALLLGPMMYQHIFQVPAPKDLPEQVAQAFWRAFALKPNARTRPKYSPAKRSQGREL